MKCFPPRHSRDKLRATGAGVVGALKVAKGTRDDHAIEGERLPLEIAVGLTQTRGFVFALSTTWTKAWGPAVRVVPRELLVGVGSRSGRMLHVPQTVIWLRLADGSELALETAQCHKSNGEQFISELLRTVPRFGLPED